MVKNRRHRLWMAPKPIEILQEILLENVDHAESFMNSNSLSLIDRCDLTRKFARVNQLPVRETRTPARAHILARFFSSKHCTRKEIPQIRIQGVTILGK